MILLVFSEIFCPLFRVLGKINFHFNARHALMEHIKLCGRGLGQIKGATTDVGAAIVDAHHDRFMVNEVGHFDEAAKRQSLVGGGKLVHVVFFAVGCCAPMKGVAVPAGLADKCKIMVGAYGPKGLILLSLLVFRQGPVVGG